jgi:hypothetical protein
LVAVQQAWKTLLIVKDLVNEPVEGVSLNDLTEDPQILKIQLHNLSGSLHGKRLKSESHKHREVFLIVDGPSFQAFVEDLQVGVSDVDYLMEIEGAVGLEVELDLKQLQTRGLVYDLVNQSEHRDRRGLNLITLLQVLLEVLEEVGHLLLPFGLT